MKPLLLILFTFSISLSSFAAFTTSAPATTSKPVPGVQQSVSIASLTIKDLQKYLGRKLTIKEKVQFLLAKKLADITDPEDEELARKGRNKAYLGFGFGIAGIFLLPFFAIPALIISNGALAYDKEKPGILGDARGFAKAGQIMGWVGIAILILVFLWVLVLIAAWGGG
jgi:hypothetical protein